jgi:hypothetical protein
MIVFDLICSKEHTFEAWFRDSKAFESQRRRKAVSCPICGDQKIDKALMAPNISTSKAKQEKEPNQPTAETARLAMEALREVRRQVEENCDYVGPEFADEARKIHYGETEQRDIYGEATKEEADELRDEGVEFSNIPWVPRADS